MSNIARIIENLQDTEAAIARAEKMSALHTHTPSASLRLKSLLKRQQNLEAELAEETNSDFVDVCSYRLFPHCDFCDQCEYDGTNTFIRMFEFLDDDEHVKYVLCENCAKTEKKNKC